jgi:acyl-CoA reductase-like NAD-dependent aldehyde dehydrogenase
MFNTGQVCVAIKRVFVQEEQYEEMVQELGRAANASKFGDGMDAGTQYGPINNKMQVLRWVGVYLVCWYCIDHSLFSLLVLYRP